MTKDELFKKLHDLSEDDGWGRDEALLEYVNDPEITKVWDATAAVPV
tara:strand:+ start:175 stop:315 length:141 start_codon:yes stop_codon:yes gene_type:complete